MKYLFLDLSMGASGDMLTAALYELLEPKKQEEFINKMNSLGAHGIEVRAEQANVCGICGTHMNVLIKGKEEHEHSHEEHHHTHEHEHNHSEHNHCEHQHSHEHEHHHSHHEHHGMHDIEHIISHLNISEKVKKDVLNIYGYIAEAESHAHGRPVNEIHFHEVGTLDAVCDVAAVCVLMDELKPDKIVASPVCVGGGSVKCAHGILPVPAPATAFILKGIPSYGGEIKSELCTPTGAALIKYFVDEFSNMPTMSVTSIGYGIGTKRFENVANALRIMMGEVSSADKDSVSELVCNMDDITGEEAGYVLEKLMAKGAREAFYESVYGKKSRPGLKLTVIVDEAHKKDIIACIFKHTPTIGIREFPCERYVLQRNIEEVATSLGSIKRKVSEGYGVTRSKWEEEDLARIADEKGLSLREVREKISKE